LGATVNTRIVTSCCSSTTKVASRRLGWECPAPRSRVDRLLIWSAGQSRRRVAPEGLSGGRLRMGRSRGIRLSETRKYRKFTAKQKLEIVLASLRGDRSIVELCREHEIAESLLRKWREQALEAAAERFESGQERSLQAEQRRRIAQLERALGRKTYELEIAGEALR